MQYNDIKGNNSENIIICLCFQSNKLSQILALLPAKVNILIVNNILLTANDAV